MSPHRSRRPTATRCWTRTSPTRIATVTGPYTKGEEPLLTTDAGDGRCIGPGGQDVVVAPDGSERLAFHSWHGANTYRGMNMLELTWDDGRPVVGTGTAG